MNGRSIIRLAALAFSTVLVAGAGVAAAGAAAADTGHASGSAHSALYVSPHGESSHNGRSCSTAKYSTIQSAVDAASKGAIIIVCHGTYAEDVVVSKALTLKGDDHPVITAVGTTSRMCQFIVMGPPVTGPCLAGITITASNVAVSGFTVKGSQGEGILATGTPGSGSISHIWVTDNTVKGNDLGGPTSAYPQCQGPEPDCGEGVHFMGVTHSVIHHNKIVDNSGGVLFTDEVGPTSDNLVSDNLVAGNTRDCGITMPGHNPFAYVTATKKLQPKVAGVFDNTVRDNVITGNGTKGFGAGVLMAVPIPGSASYDNLIVDNFIAGNGLAGVTLHDHLPGGAYMNGNRIIDNKIGKNNLLGDQFDTNPPAPLTVPTGIIVYSGADHVGITIARNVIFDNTDGVWRTTNVKISGFGSNVFHHVAHHLVSVAPM